MGEKFENETNTGTNILAKSQSGKFNISHDMHSVVFVFFSFLVYSFFENKKNVSRLVVN